MALRLEAVDDQRPALALDRHLFLHLLQLLAPAFWQSLQGSTTNSGEGVSVDAWATHYGIQDPWFLEVLQTTVTFWGENPGSPRTKLEPGWRWFELPEFPDGRRSVKPFAPVFDGPWPLVTGRVSFLSRIDRDLLAKEMEPLGRLEWPPKPPGVESWPEFDPSAIDEIQEFEKRMRQQFEEQLSEHKKYLRNVTRATRPKALHSAVITVLAFTGMSAPAIARRMGMSEDSESAVYKAVERFAKSIELTLPPTPYPSPR